MTNRKETGMKSYGELLLLIKHKFYAHLDNPSSASFELESAKLFSVDKIREYECFIRNLTKPLAPPGMCKPMQQLLFMPLCKPMQELLFRPCAILYAGQFFKSKISQALNPWIITVC